LSVGAHWMAWRAILEGAALATAARSRSEVEAEQRMVVNEEEFEKVKG